MPNRGTLLTQQGHAAYPGWADLLSDICPISDCCNTHIPVFMILPTHSIPVVLQFLSSANHPDNWLTVARQSTICLSEYYNKKPDNLTVFQKFSFFTKNQRYLQLLLISTNLNPNRSVVMACLDFALLEERIWIKETTLCATDYHIPSLQSLLKKSMI